MWSLGPIRLYSERERAMLVVVTMGDAVTDQLLAMEESPEGASLFNMGWLRAFQDAHERSQVVLSECTSRFPCYTYANMKAFLLRAVDRELELNVSLAEVPGTEGPYLEGRIAAWEEWIFSERHMAKATRDPAFLAKVSGELREYWRRSSRDDL